VENRGGPGLHGKRKDGKAGLWNEIEIQNGFMHHKDIEKDNT